MAVTKKPATAHKAARNVRAKAKLAKTPKAPATAAEILKHVKPTKVEALTDAPTPSKTPKKTHKTSFEANADRIDPRADVKALIKKLDKQNFEFHPADASAAFDSEAFDEFFAAEIAAMVEVPAEVVNDRFARWPCQCCDVVIPVPRRTEVFHGDYHLVHDDIQGLLVNGERWIPRAETPLEVVQPGRLRNPWTGKTLEGKTLGTTGVH